MMRFCLWKITGASLINKIWCIGINGWTDWGINKVWQIVKNFGNIFRISALMALLGSIFTIRCQIRARDSWIVLTCLASCAFWKWEMFIAEQWSAYHKKIRVGGFITHQAGAELFFSCLSILSNLAFIQIRHSRGAAATYFPLKIICSASLIRPE